jgi:hypothetical protein
MTKERIEKIRWWMLRTQRSPLLAALYRSVSRFVMWRAGHRLAALPGVAAVFSRHTHPRLPTFVPGHSDLDLTIVLEDDHADNPDSIRRCSTEMNELGRRYLFTKAEDARFMSRGELCRLSTDLRSSFELFCRPEEWLLIAGSDVRPRQSVPLPSRCFSRHPEFNRWWENVIQTQYFRPSVDLKRGFMRSLYRSALKNQVQLEAATGVSVAKPERFVGDELSGLEFRESPRLREILAEIKENHLWADRPEILMSEILAEVLNGAERFFAECNSDGGSELNRATAHSGAGESSKRQPGEPHAQVFRALEAKLSENPEITGVLRSAVAYALPHAHPYIYRLDLLLRDDLSAGQLGTACEAMRRCLGEKNFAAADFPVEFALIPAGIYRNPLFFLGMPCAFLLEHVRAFGATVYGSVEPCLPSPWPRRDLLDWCRMFVPYHMVTFRRRLEYGSPVLNFCQLAGLRIFLERDERLSDGLEIRTRYREQFVNARDEDVVDYLFRYPADPGNTALYDRATEYVAGTYAALESQLARQDSCDNAGGVTRRA